MFKKVALGLIFLSTMLHGADDRNQISKQLLKQELKRITVANFQKKLREGAQESAAWNGCGEGFAPYMRQTYLWFKNSFYTEATDQLTLAILNRVRAIESSPSFRDTREKDSDFLATPKRIDDFTGYNRGVDDDGKTFIVCTTDITDKEFLQAAIREIEQNQ